MTYKLLMSIWVAHFCHLYGLPCLNLPWSYTGGSKTASGNTHRNSKNEFRNSRKQNSKCSNFVHDVLMR